MLAAACLSDGKTEECSFSPRRGGILSHRPCRQGVKVALALWAGREERCERGRRGGWCPRRDSNPRPQDSYHFGFRRRRVTRRSWSGLSLHHDPASRMTGAARTVSTPSAIPENRRLARDRHGMDARAFPEFEQIRHEVSRHDAQFSGILCSILLSYADHHGHCMAAPRRRQGVAFQFFLFPVIGCNTGKSK